MSEQLEFTLLKVGDRVVRGPHWKWGDQDLDANGTPTEGTVTEFYSGSTENFVSVQWDNGHRNTYNLDFIDEVVLAESTS